MKSGRAGSRAEEAIAAVTMTAEERQEAARLRAEFGEPRLKLVRREDAEKETRRTGLFGEYLYRGLDTTCNAATGDGKTTLWLGIARAIVADEESVGIHPAESGPVLFVATENPIWNLKEKLENMGGWPDGLLFLQQLDLHRDADELSMWIQSEGCILVVLDTLAKTWRMRKEDDNAEGTALATIWEQVLSETNAAGITLHHIGKSRNENASYRGRGNTATPASAHIVLNLERREGGRPDDGIRRLVLAKTRVGVHVPPLVFRLAGEDRFELCADPEGWETSNEDAACGAALTLLPAGLYKTNEVLSHPALGAFSRRTVERVLQRRPAGVTRIQRGVYAICAVELPPPPPGEFKETWPEERPPFAP